MNNSTNVPNITMIPLALFSLGVSIFLLAGNAWGSVSDGGYATFALFTGGLGCLIVCILAYRAGAIFGYVSTGALGTFFASSAFYHWFFTSAAQNPVMSHGWMAGAWAVVFFFIAIASFGAAEIPAPGKLLWVLLFLFFLFRWLNVALHMDWALKVEAIDGIIAAILAWIGGFVTLRSAMK
jgi:succinate-acetate transporter protein